VGSANRPPQNPRETPIEMLGASRSGETALPARDADPKLMD
jgi:hypothetical protein